jgi:PKD repeat protein
MNRRLRDLNPALYLRSTPPTYKGVRDRSGNPVFSLVVIIGLLLLIATISTPIVVTGPNVGPSETVAPTPISGPMAAFTYDSCEDLPTPCMVPGFPATFDASFSSSPNGRIVFYTWNFGDLSDSYSSNHFNSTNPSAAHNYMSYQNGSTPWKVTLTVKDSSGLIDTISQMVSPEVYPKFTFRPSSPSSGEAVIFNGSATSFSALIGSPSNTTKGYSWSFGDGTSASGAFVSHVYSVAGLYRVVLTVSTAYGSGEASKAVSVGADPPASSGGSGGAGHVFAT